MYSFGHRNSQMNLHICVRQMVVAASDVITQQVIKLNWKFSDAPSGNGMVDRLIRAQTSDNVCTAQVVHLQSINKLRYVYYIVVKLKTSSHTMEPRNSGLCVCATSSISVSGSLSSSCAFASHKLVALYCTSAMKLQLHLDLKLLDVRVFCSNDIVDSAMPH